MNTTLRLAALLSALAISSVALPARAGLESCGNIDVSASANCTAIAQGGCTTKCEQVSFEAACDAQLSVSCQGQCNKLPSVTCTGSCDSSCQAECTPNPGSFDCNATCTADCQGSCTSKCSTAADKTKCTAQCNATCSGQCQTSCSGTAPTADCNAKCSAKCSGQCTADMNMDCQLNCQTTGFATCQTQLKGGCVTQCSQPEGAIFCDTQYVDRGNNAKQCIAALDAWLTANVTIDASASGSCSAGTCQGQAEASASCAMSDKPTDGSSSAVALAGLAGLTVLARRRRGRA